MSAWIVYAHDRKSTRRMYLYRYETVGFELRWAWTDIMNDAWEFDREEDACASALRWDAAVLRVR